MICCKEIYNMKKKNLHQMCISQLTDTNYDLVTKTFITFKIFANLFTINDIDKWQTKHKKNTANIKRIQWFIRLLKNQQYHDEYRQRQKYSDLFENKSKINHDKHDQTSDTKMFYITKHIMYKILRVFGDFKQYFQVYHWKCTNLSEHHKYHFNDNI